MSKDAVVRAHKIKQFIYFSHFFFLYKHHFTCQQKMLIIKHTAGLCLFKKKTFISSKSLRPEEMLVLTHTL
jgi:hypothetical protein